MIEPRYDKDGVTLYCGDCLEILSILEASNVDAVITDPPYPDYHNSLYKQTGIEILSRFYCRQFIFWSSKVEMPLDYTAIHIWDKRVGAGSEYERIFERNGNKNYKVFSDYLINSTVAASFTGDEFTGHPSQKPLRLIRKLIEYCDGTISILDPFMGSGTTGVACVQLGRRFIGIEIDEKYYQIAEKRIREAQMQLRLPF